VKQFATHIKSGVIPVKVASRLTCVLKAVQKTCFLVLVLLTVPVFVAKTVVVEEYGEYEIKAAFLCNFVSFVEWPENTFESDTSQVIIGILGKDPFGLNIDRIAQSYTRRRIIIQRYERVEKALNCHILFISSSKGNNLTDILDHLRGTSILTVSEIEGFCALGGIITFSKKKIKYGFEINRKSASRARIKISSKLLKLAVKIYD